MGKRGRPRHPDILTPREWEVLALMRDGLTNDQIAARLDITERTARYHVSEILSKLGVSSRHEAAAWLDSNARHEPGRRWLGAAFPLAAALRGWAGAAAALAVAGTIAVGVGLLVWGLTQADGDTDAAGFASTATPDAAATWRALVTPPSDEHLQIEPAMRGFEEMRDVAQARQWLLGEPNLAPILAAINERDVDALLDLIEWRPLCADVRSCPDADIDPVVQTGFSTTHATTEANVRPALEDLLDAPLELSFASVTRSGAPLVYRARSIDTGPIYYLAFEGPSRPVRESTIWDDAEEQTGLFLAVNAHSETPILEFGPLGETWGAAQQAFELGLGDHDLLYMETTRPVAVAVCNEAAATVHIAIDDRPERSAVSCDAEQTVDGELVPPHQRWQVFLELRASEGTVRCQDTGDDSLWRRCVSGDQWVAVAVIPPSTP